MKKFFKHLIIGTLATAGLYTTYITIETIPPVTRYLLCQHQDDDIKEYVEENLERIIQNQEQELGIHHRKRPKIKYLLPAFWRKGEEGIEMAGLYEAKKDTIYLNSGLLVHPSPDISDWLADFFTEGHVSNVYATLNHELGHFYCDSLAEAAGLGDWPVLSPKSQLDEMIGIRLVSEGIAMYFEKTATKNKEDHFQDQEWPQDPAGFFRNNKINPYLIYQGGYHFVKPIIDKYGERGILYLMVLHPQGNNLTQLPLYQQQLLQRIEQEKNSSP